AADRNFYLPEKYTDPFENATTLEYDGNYNLFIQSNTDALGNATHIVEFDYRVLAPSGIEDINGNRTDAYFDALGRVIAVAMKGKVSMTGVSEADNLSGYDDEFANPNLLAVLGYFDLPPITANEARARFSSILGNATS